MGVKPLQPSLTGGEMSPSLFGRVDLARWGVSLRTCRNFIVRPYGGIDNRPGTRFCAETKTSSKAARLIPFIVAEDQAYVVELGDFYARFYANGALVMNGGSPAEVATPWSQAEIWDVKYTQSADVMTLTHSGHQTQQLSRLTATSFQLAPFEGRNGPFQPLNADESIKVSASAVSGIVTITASSGIFNANMVGALLYLEQKEMRDVKPWVPDERSVGVGTLRRSDGKTYRCSSVPNIGGLTGTPWYQTGNVRPSHDKGRAFDGPQDTRTDGTNQYKVGVEWEFLDYGFGTVKITAYTSPTVVTAVVTQRLPESVVGGLGSPGNTWNLTGDGTTKTFTITGATSTSLTDYAVTISGAGVSPNPYYDPGIGIGGTPPSPTGTKTYVP